MFVRRTVHLVVTALAASLIAGCSAASHSATPLPPTQTQSRNARVTFSIIVPRAPASGARRPDSISPSTKSIVLFQGATFSSLAFVLTAPCSGSTCSVTTSAPVGPYVFELVLNDKADGSGKNLAVGVLGVTVQADTANAFHVTFQAEPAKAVISAPISALTLGTSASVPLTINVQDYDGNTIVGPGSYYETGALALTDSDTSNATSITRSTISGPDGTSMNVASLLYNGATPSSGNIQIGLTYKGASIATPLTIAFSGSAPPFVAGTQQAVSTMQQNATTLEGYINAATRTAYVSVQSRAVPATTGAVKTGNFTVAMNGSLSTFAASQRPVDLATMRARSQNLVNVPRRIDQTLLLPNRDQWRRVAGAQASGRTATSSVRVQSIPKIGTSQSFYIDSFPIGGGALKYVPVQFTLQAVSTHGLIWMDDSLPASTVALASGIGSVYDAAYDSDTTNFGPADYTMAAPGIQSYGTCDATGKSDGGTVQQIVPDSEPGMVNVLITNPSALGSGVGGYFGSGDLAPQSLRNCESPRGFSNEAKLIVLGAFASLTTAISFRGDAAHETQHLIHYINHNVLRAGAYDPSWIDEGMSMLAEDLAAGGVDPNGPGLATNFFNAPQDYSLVAFSGFENGKFTSNCGGCYGQSYLFMRYLTDRFGTSVMTKMEQTNMTSIENVLQATGLTDFPQLVSDFDTMIAVSGTGITNDPKYSLTSWNIRGGNEFGYTFNGPAFAGNLTPGGSVPVTGAYQGAPVFFSVSGLGGTGNAVKVTDQSNGLLSLFGSIGQK